MKSQAPNADTTSVKLAWYLVKDYRWGFIPVEVIKVEEGIVTFMLRRCLITDSRPEKTTSVSRFLVCFELWEDDVVTKILIKYGALTATAAYNGSDRQE